jgi:hypothetical protein
MNPRVISRETKGLTNVSMYTKGTIPTQHFEVRAGYAFVLLVGCVTLEQAADAVLRALVTARDQGIKRLLVDASQLTGFPSPAVADRYFIVRRWAAKVGKSVELSIVLPQYVLDPDRFGMMVAANLGMRADAFSSSSEALTWLLSGRPARVAASNQNLNAAPAEPIPPAGDAQ